MSREITKQDLKELEQYADKLFSAVGIDVAFTRHFLDRVNDTRNKTQITVEELTRLFREEYAKWGKKIAQLGPDAEAIMKDMRTNINLPFVLKLDNSTKQLDLVAKTVMRKKDFRSPDREFKIAEEVSAGGGAIAGLGVGPQGEPGRSAVLQPMLRRKKFAGHEVFEVKSDMYHRARMSRKKGQHWRTYLDEDEYYEEIRDYARKNKGKAIVLQDENTGAMFFAQFGKR